MAQGIVPRYKLLITYDINDGNQEGYYQFVLRELVPAMQAMGLYMLEVYHTAYGNYPIRQLEFVAENIETIHKAMKTDKWQVIQDKFGTFTCNYQQKVVRYHSGFQF